MVDLADCIACGLVDDGVNGDEADSFAAFCHPAEAEGCDIYARFAEHVAELTDEARTVIITYIEHMLREGRVHLNAK